MRRWVGLVVAVAIVASIGMTARATPQGHDDPPASTTRPPIRAAQFSVRSSVTDANINDLDAGHAIYVPDGGGNGKLLVFLPGTNGTPANVSLFLAEAARVGYHVIGLEYPNATAAVVCQRDMACFSNFRQAIVDTGGSSADWTVRAPDTIHNRLVKLLAHLTRTYPDAGWAGYLDQGDLAYGAIAFAGHSQGGGHAAWIAKHHEVARVLMFSSVVDAADGDPPTPASWVSATSATPIERYWGFDHEEDKFARKIAANWVALGMNRLGARTPIDGRRRPFPSHQLVTSVSEPDGKRAHSSVIGDHATPLRSDGVPIFLEVWDAMLLD